MKSADLCDKHTARFIFFFMAVLDFCIDGSIVHGGLKVVANDDEVFCHNGVEDKLIGGKVI
jgi:hypothetical protein